MPEFTEEESEKLKESLDFVGLNYYGAFFSTPLANVNSSQLSYGADLRVNWTGSTSLIVFKKFLSKWNDTFANNIELTLIS